MVRRVLFLMAAFVACPLRGLRRVVGPGLLSLLATACPLRGLRRVVGPGLLSLLATACPLRGLRRVVGPGLLSLLATACGARTPLLVPPPDASILSVSGKV